MRCKNCGTPLPQGSMRCVSCGTVNMPTSVTGPNQGQPMAPGRNPSGLLSRAAQNGGQPVIGSNGAMSRPNSYPPPTMSTSTPMPSAAFVPPHPPMPPVGPTTPPRLSVPQTPHAYLPTTGPHQLQAQDTSGRIQSGAFTTGPQAVPAEKKPGIGNILMAVVLVSVMLALVCGGLIYLGVRLKSTTATNTRTTPAGTRTTTFSNIPSNIQAVPTAVAILSGGQTTSAINSNYQPTAVTQNFTAKQTVYFTFHVDSQRLPGYVQVKWYLDGQVISTDILAHSPQNDHGYFSLAYNVPGSGAAAMYWCTQPTCSDAQLAQVVTFFVNK